MSSAALVKWKIFGVVMVLALVFLGASAVVFVSLRNTQFFSGWSLLGLTLLLTSYNLRKKLPFLPLGSSTSWLRLHLGAGWIAILVFAQHVGFQVPNGRFEGLLALVFVLVAGSGIVGLILSKVFPSRLATRGQEVLFERTSGHYAQVRQEVERLVLESVEEGDSTTLADFYVERLQPFFASPKHFWRHVFQLTRPRHDLLAEISSHRRYLNDAECKTFDEIARLVRVKDDLDYHYALQRALKYWLLVHVPLTYGLLVAAVLHLTLVYAFAGGLP